MDDEPRAGVTGLAAVVEDPHPDGVGRDFEIADVGEHDLRALPAELERDGLDVRLADGAEERPPDLGGARERDLVDRRVAGERIPDDGARTRDDVEDAVRQAGFGRELREAQGGQRRLGRRLEHDRVAGREGGAELPGGDDQRVVPGHDRGDHPDRLAGDEREGIGPGRADLAVDLVDRLGVPLDGLGGGGDVDREGVADRLPDVERLQQGQLVAVGPDEVGELQQDALAVRGRLIGPAAVVEGRSRRLDGPFDVLDVPLGDVGDARAVATRDVREGRSRRGRHEPAIDERLVARGDARRHGPASPRRSGGRGPVRGRRAVMRRTSRWRPRPARRPGRARTARAGRRRGRGGWARPGRRRGAPGSSPAGRTGTR